MDQFVERHLRKARDLFEAMLRSESEQISRNEALEIAGSPEVFEAARSALLATGKVVTLRGRGGGLGIRLVQGNRREWVEAADSKARDALKKWNPAKTAAHDGTAFEQLEEVAEYWSQSQIADALGVSQASVSNWLRKRTMGTRYVEAIKSLLKMLKKEGITAEEPDSALVEETPYAERLRAMLGKKKMDVVTLARESGVHVNTLIAILESRTEQPQKKTRERIEKVFGNEEQGDAAEPDGNAWYYVGLPWTKDEIDQAPDEPGVYVIHDRLGRPAYVGVAYAKNSGIRSRLEQHNEKKWASVAHSFSYALAGLMPAGDEATLAKSLELIVIKFMGNSLLVNKKDIEDLRE